jgi:FMN phosphatase YigB (HAD superfamily)
MSNNIIQEDFNSKFNCCRDKTIGLYGTGKNARTILENVTGYSFSCLIAQDHLYETIYGMIVLPLEEALKSVNAIIIAAIPSSTSIVYNRIKGIVPENIPIYDLQGYLLSGDENYKNNAYWESNVQNLKVLIDSHDVISFDIFDTLITRITLFPRDIFELMSVDEKFKDIRIEAEEELYKQFENPTLTQIYDLISLIEGWNSDERDFIKNKEIHTEQSCLVLRKKIFDLFMYAVDLGKVVYLTSDMYLERTDLLDLLASLGISDGFELIVSSQYAKTKESGELYDVLIDKNPGKNILHIGDNQDTDIEKARLKGLNTFYVKKGYDILAESSCTYLLDLVHTDCDKLILGYAISEMLNDPFCLCSTKGKLNINNYRHIATCILPMTLLYLSNIVKWAGEYDEILFASRDGYYLYKLYEWYRDNNPSLNLPDGKYVYVSRSAISSMAVKSVNDIDVFLNKIVDDPKLNLKKLIENQFHISVSNDFDISTEKAVEDWGLDAIRTQISNYYNLILNNADSLRSRYLRYLNINGIQTSGEIAVVDVVTQGTLVYGLSNVFENEIDLFALGTSAVPNKYIKDESRVHSVYGNITERVGTAIYSMSDFSELHLFIEMLYASREGQFYTIDDELNPVFVSGSEYNSVLLENVQTSLQTMVERFVINGVIQDISPEFALGMLRVFSKKFSVFSDEMKAGFSFEDPYDGSIQKCNLVDFIQ